MSHIEDLISHHCPDGVARIPLKELASIQNGYAFNSKEFNNLNLGLPLVRIRDVNTGFSNTYYSGAYKPEYIIQNEDLLVGMDGDFKPIRWNHGKALLNQRVCKINPNPKQLNKNYLFHFLFIALEQISSKIQGSTVKHLSTRDLNKYPIPVPPLEVQDEIVRILDSFTELEAELEAELEGRGKQYEYYRDSLLNLENLTCRLGKEHVKLTPLGEIGAVKMCKRILKNQTGKVGDIPFYKIGTFGKEPNAYIDSNTYEKLKKKYPFPRKGNILISASGTIGNTVIYNGEPAYFQDSNIVWLQHNESIVLDKYLYYIYQMNPWVVPEGGTIKRLYNDIILKTKIPVPPLVEQERIVAILDKFDALVNDLSSGLPAEIAARRKQYEYYRDRLLTFTPAK